MSKVYYCPELNFTIEDIFGTKTRSQLDMEFPALIGKTLDQIEIDDSTEVYTVTDAHKFIKRTKDEANADALKNQAVEDKIQNEIRSIAIKNLQAKGELPQ